MGGLIHWPEEKEASFTPWRRFGALTLRGRLVVRWDKKNSWREFQGQAVDCFCAACSFPRPGQSCALPYHLKKHYTIEHLTSRSQENRLSLSLNHYHYTIYRTISLDITIYHYISLYITIYHYISLYITIQWLYNWKSLWKPPSTRWSRLPYGRRATPNCQARSRSQSNVAKS